VQHPKYIDKKKETNTKGKGGQTPKPSQVNKPNINRGLKPYLENRKKKQGNKKKNKPRKKENITMVFIIIKYFKYLFDSQRKKN
jgi:hypothetical protein